MVNKKPNPSRQDPSKSWSELPLDLLNSVLDRLGFADIQRAKSVCSSWYSILKQSVPKRQIPWLILLPNENNKKYHCTLFNPEEEDKLYKTHDFGLHFAMSACLATYGSWLLMQYPLYTLYLVNPFTKERINLPPVELQTGTIKVQGTFDDTFVMSDDHDQWDCDSIDIGSPVFWIDEKTKDYVVLWEVNQWYVVYTKKGDDMWNQIPETSDCFDMVYKDHKLYFSSSVTQLFRIFDFSGEIPLETFQCRVTVNRYDLHELELGYDINTWRVFQTKLVVTVTGDVLKVEKLVRKNVNWSTSWSFRVYKVYSRGVFQKDVPVLSLGDEAMLFDIGITVLANDIEAGFTRNSIYCVISSHETRSYFGTNITDIHLFNLDSKKMEKLHEFDCLSAQQLERARWIIPSFNQKCF